MAYVTPDKYSPYPRVCDICGQLRSINTMRKLDNITWVCDRHTGERTRIMLDTLNAHARPPQTWPNENPRPQNPIYPNILDASEGVLFNFIDQQITNGVRYENVTAGDGAPVSEQMIPTMAWSARYLYDLIVQNTRPERYITRAKILLNTAAAAVQARQKGFGIVSGGRAADPWFGGFLESGASTYVTNDTAAAGLALLYAYRVLGTATYLTGARAAANYLRNVQAIGRYGTNFTSSNSAGTARLYTGAVASEVSTTTGVDPGDLFYANHLFYPSGILALEFWDELETTDGDQSIGATGTANDAFISAPAQLMSTSISEMRTCWEDGITDATATLVNGLSSTTPREFFNAYPATKSQFPLITGTGRWEFQDGNASAGTMISAQNFATALGSLYAYEGATTQVTTISDWLRSFESNEDFETPDDTSDSVLARSTTGEYDSTSTLSTLLLVRDADDDYASIALNGSSLYDWGAFGLLAPLWASRHKSSFMVSRILPLNVNQRFKDGKASDGLYFDHIQLRGMSGMTFQTAIVSSTADSLISYPTGDIAPASSRDAQGADVEWNSSGTNLVEPGTHAYYDVTFLDETTSDLLVYNDGRNACPNGGVVYLTNASNDTMIATHMAAAATSTAYPFFCVGATNLTIPHGTTVGFVRVDAIPAWLQVALLISVNDAVRAAMFGATYRLAHS